MAMMPNPFICDSCKTQKSETNNWFLIWEETRKEIREFPESSGVLIPVLMFSRWSKRFLKKKGVRHICGWECVNRAVDCWLTRGFLPEEGVFALQKTKAFEDKSTLESTPESTPENSEEAEHAQTQNSKCD